MAPNKMRNDTEQIIQILGVLQEPYPTGDSEVYKVKIFGLSNYGRLFSFESDGIWQLRSNGELP